MAQGEILNASPDNEICEDGAPANPSPGLLVSYGFCQSKCSGIGTLELEQTSAFFQFILPAVIFSMAVPRTMKLDHIRVPKPVWTLEVLASMTLSLVIALLDIAVSTTVIMVAAVPMFFGALLESLLDRQAIAFLKKDSQRRPRVPTKAQVEIVASILAGNLDRDSGDPQNEILKFLMPPVSMICSTVRAPVAFYIVAFIYTIMDILNSSGIYYSRTSIALGIEWMIAVHVTLVSGCLLASNSPNTVSVLVGEPRERERSHRVATLEIASVFTSSQARQRARSLLREKLAWDRVYDTLFQPVQLWKRGHDKPEGKTHTEVYSCNSRFQHAVNVSTLNWLLQVWLPTVALIVGPPVAGCIISYASPPIEFGCTSLTFLCYAISQTILAGTGAWGYFAGGNQSFLWRMVRMTLSIIAYTVSILTVIVGTLLKVFGIYSNCLCSMSAGNWLSPAGVVQVTKSASDLDHSLRYWSIAGTFFCIFLAVLCAIAWYYQELIQCQLKETIKSLPDDAVEMDNMRRPIIVNTPPNSSIAIATTTWRISNSSSSTPLSIQDDNGVPGVGITSSSEQLLLSLATPDANSIVATSSTEQFDAGELRSRALRSTRTFPGGRRDPTG